MSNDNHCIHSDGFHLDHALGIRTCEDCGAAEPKRFLSLRMPGDPGLPTIVRNRDVVEAALNRNINGLDA